MTRMTLDGQLPADIHIRLLAGHAATGRPVFEVLPARQRDGGLVELIGSPGLVLGCAAGDVLRVDTDGEFEVLEQGKNLCIQAARLGDHVTPESFAALQAAFAEVGGIAEAPQDLRFVVVTVARSVGLPTIAGIMNAWSADIDRIEWWVGNGGVAD